LSRFLFVLTGHTTHVGAHASIAAELIERGHEVAWAGPKVDQPLPAGVVFYPADDEEAARAREAWWTSGSSGSVHGHLADLRWLYERYLMPFALTTLPAVERAADEFEANVIVADEHALAGAFAARRRRLRWATLVRSAVLTQGVRGPYWPEIEAWLVSRLDETQRLAGLDPVPRPNLSDQLVISISTPELLGPDIEFPPHYRFVGPPLDHRTPGSDDDFPWHELRDGPRLLVSLGTVLARRAGNLFQTVSRALAGTEFQVIVVAPSGALPEPPSNFLVRSSVPQIALLPHVDAVVCHAGHNTVLEALGHGLPLLVAPLTLDQPLVAEQVVRSGAGVRVRAARARVDEIAGAVASITTDPAYRNAARRLQASLRSAGGTTAAATALGALAAGLNRPEGDGGRTRRASSRPGVDGSPRAGGSPPRSSPHPHEAAIPGESRAPA
jgi:MGT family glycosyltransferase